MVTDLADPKPYMENNRFNLLSVLVHNPKDMADKSSLDNIHDRSKYIFHLYSAFLLQEIGKSAYTVKIRGRPGSDSNYTLFDKQIFGGVKTGIPYTAAVGTDYFCGCHGKFTKIF